MMVLIDAWETWSSNDLTNHVYKVTDIQHLDIIVQYVLDELISKYKRDIERYAEHQARLGYDYDDVYESTIKDCFFVKIFFDVEEM